MLKNGHAHQSEGTLPLRGKLVGELSEAGGVGRLEATKMRSPSLNRWRTGFCGLLLLGSHYSVAHFKSGVRGGQNNHTEEFAVAA